MYTILIIEDEPRVASLLMNGLEENGYQTMVAYDGLMGLRLFQAHTFDLVISDIVLPKMDGFELAKEIRKTNPNIPILMLTALGSTNDKLDGFDAGADDYMVKPFDFRELNARIKVLLKRVAGNAQELPQELVYADLRIDLQRKDVERNSISIKLSPKEYNLLLYMVENAERVLSRVEIAEKVWNTHFDTGTNFIDVYINYLRKKIDRNFEPKLIHTKAGMGFIGLTAAVFFVFVMAVYYVSEHSRSNAFFRNLQSEAITKAHLFLKNQVDAKTMQSIYLNNQKFIDEVEVAVYTTDFKILYHDALQNDIVKETPEMIKRILQRKNINFYVDEYQAIGLVYPFEGKDYVVTAAAYDGYGYANRDALRNMLILLFIGGLSVLVVVGYILSRSTLKPIRNIVKEAEKITASHIDKRLPVKNEQDELGELSTTFNALLERLEKSFNSQKMFVSNVSHELRTPMAALTAELDLALLKERSSEQYQMAIGNALQDSHRIVNLIDGLLNLAKADYQSEQITMEEVRLDELLLDARELVLKAHPDYHIELVFEQEAEEDNVLTVIGNSYLLTTAFVNLVENNCKYSSNRTSSVLIAYWEQWAIIRLSDTGVGMSDTDKENLFTLFYRGENKNIAPGNGIGMALTQKIIHLHKGELTVSSHKDEGTTFVVKLPHI